MTGAFKLNFANLQTNIENDPERIHIKRDLGKQIE